MPPRIIDLTAYSEQGVGVLAGRDRGAFARTQEKLDQLDADPTTTATVKIPEWIFSVNSSFMLAMFSQSIRKLRADGFRKKYQFVGPNAEAVREDAIRKALLIGLPLPAVKSA